MPPELASAVSDPRATRPAPASHAHTGVMRVDIHPADFDLPGHVATLEALLHRAAGRDVVTYDEILA